MSGRESPITSARAGCHECLPVRYRPSRPPQDCGGRPDRCHDGGCDCRQSLCDCRQCAIRALASGHRAIRARGSHGADAATVRAAAPARHRDDCPRHSEPLKGRAQRPFAGGDLSPRVAHWFEFGFCGPMPCAPTGGITSCLFRGLVEIRPSRESKHPQADEIEQRYKRDDRPPSAASRSA
jgi:hypothetical protein